MMRDFPLGVLGQCYQCVHFKRSEKLKNTDRNHGWCALLDKRVRWNGFCEKGEEF